MSSCVQEYVNLLVTHFSSVYTCENAMVEFSDPRIPTFDLPNNIFFSANDIYQYLMELHGVFPMVTF